MTHYQVAPWRAGIADWPGHSILERALHDLQELARWDPTGTLFELSREQREGMEGMEPEGPEEEEGEEKGKTRRGMRKLGKGAMKAAGSWAMQPRLDVYDLEDKLIVQADAPGIPRDRIEVTVGNGFLTVAGSREQEEIDRSKGHFERAFGRFERRIRLPEGVKEEDVVARYESGVIRVELPKVPVEEKERRIEVM